MSENVLVEFAGAAGVGEQTLVLDSASAQLCDLGQITSPP